MARYHRVNIDGKSLFKTETRRVADAATEGLLPGTFAVIDDATDRFVVAPAGSSGRIYVIDCAYHEGLGIRDAVPAAHSAVGNYVEEGRELAILMPAGTYSKDTPISVGTAGQGVIATTGAVIGFSQDEVVLTEPDFIRVRIRAEAAAE